MSVCFARAFALALLIPLFAAPLASASEQGEVNIYSDRQPYLINPPLKAFTVDAGNLIRTHEGSGDELP